MKVRIINADRALPSLPDDQREAWTKWLAQHQLDPMRIVLGSAVTVNDTDRRITASYFKTDADGKVIFRDHDVVIEEVSRYLEAEALPCPTGMIHVTEADL